MPYKKGSLAEQAGKVRRTAKRRIARLEKEISREGTTDKDRNFYRMQIDKLRDQINSTYQINPLTHKATGYEEDSVRMAVQNLSRTNTNSLIGTSAQERKNFLTQQELNTAQPASFIGPTLGEFTKEEVKIFYRATQRAWENATGNVNRNKLILEYFGEKDLREFVRKVLKAQKKAVEQASSNSPEYEDEEELPNTSDQSDRGGSPDYLDTVNILNREKWEELMSYEDEDED